MIARGIIRSVVRPLLRLGLGAMRALSLAACAAQLSVSLALRRRRIVRQEKARRRLRGRLVAVTADACFRQADEIAGGALARDPALRERQALRGSLCALTRSLACARAEVDALEREQRAVRSSRETARLVWAAQDGLTILAPAGFETALGASRRKLAAEAATRASLSVMRLRSARLDGVELEDDPLDACGEGLGIPQE